MTTASIDPALSLLYYGTTVPPSQGQQLSAGLLTVDFIDGGLRNICYAGRWCTDRNLDERGPIFVAHEFFCSLRTDFGRPA